MTKRRRLVNFLAWAVVLVVCFCIAPARAVILWSDLGATLVHETGAGSSFLTGRAMDILGGALRRGDTDTNVLYFKFHVDPLSDVSTEEYFAAFQFYERDVERLGVGNSLKAWAYSAFRTQDTGTNNKVFGDVDLQSSRPEPAAAGVHHPYEMPRRGTECTIVFKVEYVPDGDDLVTVWLNPDLGSGATEESQPESLTTRFKANASFDEIRLRHGGGGGGWIFSDLAIATSFNDFVAANGGETVGEPIEGDPNVLPLTFRSWLREQGLPHNSVRALAQTRDRYLWIGSDDGVARFDGVRFVAFGMRDGMWNGPVNVLFEDREGALWIGTAGGGLVRLQNGQFSTFTTRDGLPSDTVLALVEDTEGRLWIGTEAGLGFWKNGQPTTLDGTGTFQDRPVPALFKDARGEIWVGATGAGVFHFSQGKFQRVTEATLENLLADPHCLLVDRAGRLWVGAGDDYVLCQDNDQWHRYRIPRHLARPYVGSLAEQPDGTVWAGSVSEGLFRFKGGKLLVITAGSGLSDNFVQSLLVDREGNLWVGTAAGLNRLRHSQLAVYSQNEGLGYGPVQGLAEVSPNVIWAGKSSDGLYRWEGRTFARLNLSSIQRSVTQVNTLLHLADGSCWVGAAQGLLRIPEPLAVAPQVESTLLAGLNVLALSPERGGGVWAGTREGQVWLIKGGQSVAQSNLFKQHPVTVLLQSRDDTLWIGTEGEGLYWHRAGKSGRVDRSIGLLSDLIRSLHWDSADTLWIGTAGGGLARWVEGRVDNFTAREGLPDNTISQILEDNRGRLWLGTSRGIACVSKRELIELAAREIPALYPQVYGRAEGMFSEECTGGFCPAGLKASSGLLWFPTTKGVVVADPRPRSSDVLPPQVLIEEVLVDGVAVLETHPAEWTPGAVAGADGVGAPANVVQIPPGKHRIEVRYSGLNFNAPERLRFRYRLEGLDADWVEAGTRRAAFYSYVPPGQYVFRVTACNSSGVWNDTGAIIGLKVLPRVWQTWWFITLAVVGLLGTVVGVARFVEKRKTRVRLNALEQERVLARERARIAQDLHDDLGSSLARISLLSGLVKEDKHHSGQVEDHINKIAQSADDTVRALEEIVWAVRPGSDTLQSLVEYIAHFANEQFADAQTRCRLDLPHDLPELPLAPELRHNIFLIVKEALTNVLWHANATRVRVSATVTNGALEIVIQDDGEGFDPEAHAAEGRRNGLINMRRRAEVIGATLTMNSAPGKGTTIRLNVPIPDWAARKA